MNRTISILLLLFTVYLSGYGSVTVKVGETETLYCTAIAPEGYIDHVFFFYTNTDDANYLGIEYNSADGKATLYGFQEKANIKIEVQYSYTYLGNDNRRHVGTGSYYEYVTVKHNLVTGTAYLTTTEEGHEMWFMLTKYDDDWCVSTVVSNHYFSCFNSWDVEGKVTIPNKVQGFPVKMIAANSFFCCWGVTEVVIPANVEDIGKDAFYECSMLSTIVCLNPFPPKDNTADYTNRKNAFNGCPSSAVLYVPKGSKSRYQSAIGWKEFSNIKEIGVDGIVVESIELNYEQLNMKVGDTKQLTATVSPANATYDEYYWSSNKESIVTVSQTGYVIAHAPGTATITCKARDGSGVSATCRITVTKDVKVTSVYVSPRSTILAKGKTKQLSASVSPWDATDKTVIWSSSDKSVATVSSTGLVTGKAEGHAIITCTTNDGGYSGTCEVKVKNIRYATTKQEAKEFLNQKWTWDAGGSEIWGNMGYHGGSGKEIGESYEGLWWGVKNTDDFAGQRTHRGDDTIYGDESTEAYMMWYGDGTIKTYDKDNVEIRKGTFSLNNWTGNYDDYKLGDLKIEGGSLLFPFAINKNGFKPTEFELAYLTKDNMVLVYADPGIGDWSEATYWRFRSAGSVDDNSEMDVTMSSAGYATFYDSNSAYTLPSGLSAQVVTDCADGKLTYKTIANGGGIIPRGTAVMLVNEKKTSGTFTLTESESSSTYTGINYLCGSDVNTTTTASGNNYYYKLTYGNKGSELQNVFGWYWGNPDGSAFQIEAHKAWLALPKTMSRGLSFDAEGEANGIYEIPENEESNYYDLQGRPLSRIKAKGMYISNGRKIIVK